MRVRVEEVRARRHRLRRRLLWALAVWVTFRTFLVLAFRLQVGPVMDAVRRFNKRVLNPAMMRLAGRRHWYAAVIRHRGRRSGGEYATPIWAEPTADGLIVPLPYGENVDWLKNALAEGRCTIETKGASYPVGGLEVVAASAAEPLLPGLPRFLFRFYGVRSYLKARVLSRTRRRRGAEARRAHGMARA